MAKSLSSATSESQGAKRSNLPGDVEPEVFDRNLSGILRHRYGPLALAEAAFKKAKKDEKKLYAGAKVDGIRIDVLKRTIRKRDLEKTDPGKGQEIVMLEQRYDAMAGLSPGEQASFNFDKIPDGDEKDKVRWHQRGFDDIRYGAIDPEGFIDKATGEKSAGPIMPNIPPSYVPAARHPDWVAGAREADVLNQRDFMIKNGGDPDLVGKPDERQPDLMTPPSPPAPKAPAAEGAAKAPKKGAKTSAEVFDEEKPLSPVERQTDEPVGNDQASPFGRTAGTA